MSDAIGIQIVLLWQRKFEEDQLSGRQPVELFEYKDFKEGLGFGFLGAMDIHFRFDDGHQARCKDLRGHLELLIYDVSNSSEVELVDHRTHLGAENALRFGFSEQRSELR